MDKDQKSENEHEEPSPIRTPEGLLWMGGAGFLLVGVGYLIRIASPMEEPPFRLLTWQGKIDLIGSGIGLGVGLILFAGFLASERVTWKPLLEIRTFVKQGLRDALRKSSFAHFFVVGFSAGVCEEYFFRGVLEPRIGFMTSNVIFALFHSLTLLYFVLAFFIGGIMSLLVGSTGSLWSAIVAHAVYDMAVLYKLASECRREQVATAVNDTGED